MSKRRESEATQYDAIVVGAGAAGGLASVLLCEAGLRVLTLDAGWRPPPQRAPYRALVAAGVPRLAELRHWPALPGAIAAVGEKALKAAGRVRQPVQSKVFAWMLAPDAFVDDRDFPYATEAGAPFHWYRTHQIGGRMIVPGHGRQYHRLDPQTLAAWPFEAGALSTWYDKVERRLGIDDSVVPSGGEAETLSAVRALWPDVQTGLGRSAAPPALIDAALETGRLTCTPGAVVRNVEIENGRVTGVIWAERATGAVRTARAPIVFLCASALESTRILLSSDAGAGAPGARSGALGRHIMDHVTVTAGGEGPAFAGAPELEAPGRCVFIPCFSSKDAPFSMQIYRWSKGARTHFTAVTFSEMAPRAANFVTLDTARKDACGNPTLRIACSHGADDIALAAKQTQAVREIAGALGVSLSRIDERPASPGTAMHECGGARMGDDPAQSVLDPNNECWDAKGLYVTDGAAFPSQGAQHPTLTIMALTARACAHATRALQWAAAMLLKVELFLPLAI